MPGRLMENMFYNFKRFDFGRVGRYKINKRLDLNVPNTIENRVMRLEDIEAIIAEMIRLNNTQEPADEIDSLANRRVKLVGELVQRQFRIGLLEDGAQRQRPHEHERNRNRHARPAD